MGILSEFNDDYYKKLLSRAPSTHVSRRKEVTRDFYLASAAAERTAILNCAPCLSRGLVNSRTSHVPTYTYRACGVPQELADQSTTKRLSTSL